MKQDITTLKEYFETGDKPSQQNYADLIDSLGMPMIGEIKAVSFAFAPEGWRKCNGELLDPAMYPELFALIGTTYGGDGTSTFAVPNICGRVPVGYGIGDGLSSYSIGQVGGEENHTLVENEIPIHDHSISIEYSQDMATRNTPLQGDVVASGIVDTMGGDLVNLFGPNTNPIANSTVSSSYGGNIPHNNLQPYLAVNYLIAVKGINPL